jgi:signal transduction histidine kinase
MRVSVQVPAGEMDGKPLGPDGWRRFGWLVLGTGAFVALAVFGRWTMVDQHALSLVWPAAGISVLLLGMTAARWWPLIAGVVALATFAVYVIEGSTPTNASVFAVSNVVQAIGAVLLLRVLARDLVGVGGDRRLQFLRDFMAVVVASVIASLASAAVGSLGLAFTLDAWVPQDFFVWWGRNTAGSLVVTTLGILVLGVVLGARRSESWGDPHALAPSSARDRVLEATMLGVVTVIIYLIVFDWYAALPVAFPLLVPTVWAGLRFPPLPVALHSLVVSVVVIGFTVVGQGPFASVSPWQEEAFLAQVFVLLVFSLGMLLSLTRSERIELTQSLSRERGESANQAQMMSAVIESMTDGLTLVDGSGNVIMRNTAGASIAHARSGRDTDVSQYVMTDTSGRELRHDELPQIRIFASQEDLITQDVVLRFVDRSPSRTLSISARKLPTSDGGPPDRAVLVYRDVTADRAQRSALESFAGVVAHDLLGPLSIIEGWTEMLTVELEAAQQLSREDAAPKLARVRAASTSMQRLIGDLLASSTSRSQELHATRVDLDAVARAVAAEGADMTAGVRPLIEVDVLPAVHADEAMVRQLLNNLIGNAVKYVRPGHAAEIAVRARRLGDRVEVAVVDRGIGIPAEARDQVFEAFHRAHEEQGYDGHGIGLAVCKDIVERHGGRIAAVAPLDGTGTRVVFTLPAA